MVKKDRRGKGTMVIHKYMAGVLGFEVQAEQKK
jgi:hypothetical protein